MFTGNRRWTGEATRTFARRPDEFSVPKDMKKRLETYDAAAGSKTKQDCVGGEDNGGEVLGTGVHGLKIDLLSARTGEHGAIFEPDKQAGEGQYKAEDPEHERDPDKLFTVIVSIKSFLKFLNSHVVSTTTIACAY